MAFNRALTVIIKIGTSSVVDEENHTPRLSTLCSVVETVTKLRKEGHNVILVSSGAVGLGLGIVGLTKKPNSQDQVKALAALGQCQLLSLWDRIFQELGQPIAQVLLLEDDIYNRSKNLQTANTIRQLLKMGVVPILNENDAVSISSIGGNDFLAVAAAEMIGADVLVFLTDVDCLYDKNPRVHAGAKAIHTVRTIEELQVDVSSKGSDLGTGGMSTKISAAQIAASIGVTSLILHSSRPSCIIDIVHDISSEKQLIPDTKSALPSKVPMSTKRRSSDAPRFFPHTRFLSCRGPTPDPYGYLIEALNRNTRNLLH